MVLCEVKQCFDILFKNGLNYYKRRIWTYLYSCDCLVTSRCRGAGADCVPHHRSYQQIHQCNSASYVFNTAAYFGTSTTSLNPFTYANPFVNAQADTTYHVGLSIAQLNYIFPASRLLNYTIKVGSKSTVDCPILFYTSNANKINLLVIYILIIQPGFMDLSFYYFWTTLGSNFNQGQNYTRTSVGITSQPIATSSVYCSLIGLDVVVDATYQVGFSLVVKQINSWDITITLTSISAKKTTVNSFFALVFLYNNAQLLAVSPAARYIKGSFSGTNGNNALLMAADTTNAFRVYNTIIGMNSFWIKGDSFFNYVTLTTLSVSISATSTNAWKSLGFDYNVFEFWYCPDTTPYLMVSTNICYDLCPIRYASNTSDFQCDQCPTVDCYYCGNNGKCTQCSDTVDFRVMDNTTMRCIPLPGYYESGVSAASPCVAANCLTCTSTTYCLSCALGKYLTASHTCLTCMANCLNCTSATNCAQCATYYIFSVTACIANCSNVTNCLTCAVSSGIVCSTCFTGYVLASNVCSSVCGDNILVGTEVCDDGNTDNGDGCSSTCTIQPKFYCNNTAQPRVCGSCVANCDNCTNPTACVKCSVGYTPVSGLCTLDCLVVTNCSTCEYNLASNSTVCLTCLDGYAISGNTCVSTCGDGIRVPQQGCDDGNLNTTDGCSPTCTVQATFYCTDVYPTSASTCAHCINFCQACSNATSCTTCNTGYTYSASCIIDCSPIAKCSACDYTTASICTDCAAGYHLDNGTNSCNTQCGDGFKNGAEACDDGNLNDTDGCSSTCAIEVSFHCNDVNVSGGVKSICTACITFCSSCFNSTSCDGCNAGYSYSPANNSCNIDCSSITLCIVCNFTGAVSCETCQAGYYLVSNTCASRCGDGILLPIQSCDDGNNITGDGCSATCVLEPAFLCTNTTNATTTYSYTSCNPCLAHCVDCTGNINDCQGCQTDYIYKTTAGVVTCEVDCAIFADCSSCTFAQCTTCMPNYGFGSSRTCIPVCGDSKVLLGQSCDDGNTVNGDGCSSTCQLQPNFTCHVPVQTSVCSLLSISIDLVSINKNPTANQVAIQYLLSPSTLPAFSTLNWSTVVYQQSNLSLTFSTMNYDNTTGQLIINANYAQDLNYQLLQLGFNFPLTAPFNLINASNTSTVLVSANNLSLQVYQDSTYLNSKMLEYLALGTSCLALVLFILGYFSGKLIGLECITVFQLTFLSLLTFENLSPSFASLSLLSYSCGYNIKNMQSSQVNLGRRFKTVGFSEPFLSNYNLTFALVVIPLLVSLVMAIINRIRYKSANPTLIKYSELMRGEFCFYGLMFSAFSIILSLGIEVGHIGSGMMGLAAGGLLVLVILTYSVLLHKKPQIFGEFNEKFNKDSVVQSHYYCFLVVERVFTTGGLLLVFFNPQGAIILAMLALQIVLVVWKQPYKGERAWLRPFLNLLIAALIQLIFLLNPMLAKFMPAYSLYGSFAVIGLLATTLLYNIYYFVQNLRAKVEKSDPKQQEQEQNNFIKQEYNKLDNFFKKVMESPKFGMLDKTSGGLQLEQPGSPSKLHGGLLSEVRGKLSKVKINSAHVSNLSISQDISFEVDADL